MKIFLLILFSCAFSANAQIINASPAYVSTYQYLLDAYPGASAAYSTRKLKSSYSGNAIRVRRSSDNAEQDIGFVGEDLDTATMKTFVGAGNTGFISKWYNQGDSATLDFENTAATSQPRIIISGVVERQKGKPSIYFDAARFLLINNSANRFNYLHKTGQAAVFALVRTGIVSNPNAAYCILDNCNTTQSQTGYSLFYDDRSSVSSNDMIRSYVFRGVNTTSVSQNSPNNYFTPNTFGLITNLLDNGNATAANRNFLYNNGANEQKLNTFTSTPSTSDATNVMRMGRSIGGAFNLIGNISELVIYPSNQSGSRTAIENNIKSFYGL
jgi:hypothetical protein